MNCTVCPLIKVYHSHSGRIRVVCVRQCYHTDFMLKFALPPSSNITEWQIRFPGHWYRRDDINYVTTTNYTSCRVCTRIIAVKRTCTTKCMYTYCTYLANIWYISSFTKFGPHFSRLFPVACMNMRFSAFLIREEFYMCPAEKNDLIKPLKPYLYLHNNANFIHFIYVSNLWIYCFLSKNII